LIEMDLHINNFYNFLANDSEKLVYM